MKTTRAILAESHVARVAVAVLLLWTIEWTIWSLWTPLFFAVDYISNALAIWGIPSGTFPLGRVLQLIPSAFYLGTSILSFGAAWLVSWWVYGTGPIQCLKDYSERVSGESNA